MPPRAARKESGSSVNELRLNELLACVVNALPIVVYALDDNGKILLAEGHALAAMGSNPGARVGESVFDVFAGEPDTLSHLRRSLAGERHEADIRLGRNGRCYHLWYIPTFDVAGDVSMVTGLSLDVTEQGVAELELRRATRWLEQMLDRLPVAIYLFDAEGVLTMVRGSFIEEKTKEQVGRRLADAFGCFPQLVEAVGAALKGEDRAFSASRGGRHFEFLVSSQPEESGESGALGVCIEVTEQRQAAASLAETAEKSRFLANASHELRTPLNSMLGFAELLESSAGDSLQGRELRYLANIRKSGQLLLALINQLLGFSRLEALGPQLNTEPIDPAEVVDEVVERMSASAASRGVELSAGHQAHQPFVADRLAVLQVLLNLTSNAIKFTPRGGRVTVAGHHRSRDLHILVRDNGIGIAPEHKERIFEEFFQVRSADPTVPLGSGLGLALSRKLARAMGGDLTVHSRAGVGSTFEFRLPAAGPI